MPRASTSRRSTASSTASRGAWRGGRAGRARSACRSGGNRRPRPRRSPGGSPTRRRFPSPTGPRRFRAASGCSIPPSAPRCSPRSLPCSSTRKPPRWVVREKLAGPAVSIADDASRDAAFDGEGVASRRMLLVEHGALAGRLHDLSSARRAGATSTGHGVRPSFRLPPQLGPRRLFFETASPSSSAALLAGVTKGLFASALTAPLRVDLAGRPLRGRVHRRLDRGRARAGPGRRGARAGPRVGAAAPHRRPLDGPAVLPGAVPGGLADGLRRARELRLATTG